MRLAICAIVAVLALPAASASAETITVESTADTSLPTGANGCFVPPSTPCTLRRAIEWASANGDPNDVIVLPAGLYQLTLTDISDPDPEQGDLDALAAGSSGAESLAIIGAGARTTRIAGTGSDRVLENGSSNLTLNISGVTISGGRGVTPGGGISASGPLSLTDSTVVDNQAVDADGIAQGGGIYSGAGVSLTSVTLTGNVVSASGGSAQGGGLFNQGTSSLLNVTIAGNSADDQDASGTDGSGAGLYDVVGSGATRLQNVTVAGNTVEGTGGGTVGGSSLTFANTIVALNRTTGGGVSNCAGTPPGVSAGNNLEEGTDCGFTAAGDKRGVDPLLGPLADNGGQTDTRALLAGSPAIDAGTNTLCPSIDQRGTTRPQNGVCDIGAYEFVPAILPPPPGDDGLPPPVLGELVNVRPLSGRVTFAIPPGASAAGTGVRASQKGLKFRPLREARQLPVRSFLNTRRGKVRLTSALPKAGATQSAVFTSGLFQVLQSRRKRAKGLTELRLKGSSFRRCEPRKRGKRAQAALSRRSIRRLRAAGKGRFRTRGRYSAATVRGTKWLTVDRCDGTLTKVTRGRVAVRDFRRKKTILVKRGKRYLARAPQR